MRGDFPLPLWAVALVLAAVAPFFARALAALFSRRSRERSRRVFTSAAVRDAASPDAALSAAPRAIDGTPRTD